MFAGYYGLNEIGMLLPVLPYSICKSLCGMYDAQHRRPVVPVQAPEAAPCGSLPLKASLQLCCLREELQMC